MILQRYSESVPPTGTIDGGAAKRALGKAKMGFWDVVLREAVQNSWDARLGERISFDVHARDFSAAEIETLAVEVFGDSGGAGNETLRAWLAGDSLRALVLRDSGTRGLGGPSDASSELGADVRSDFRNFVFDIGRDPRRALGGGTYGFGKGILYEASRISTCLVYSRCLDDSGVPLDRFIAVSVAGPHHEGGKRFTGRQWWGLVDSSSPEGTSVSPLEGRRASRLAERLGIGLGEGDTGTSVVILDPQEPDTPDETLGDIATEVRDAVLKWAWPHLVSLDGAPTIHFSVAAEDQILPIVLEGNSEYSAFADAYREVLEMRADDNRRPPFTLSVHRVPTDLDQPMTGHLGLKTVHIGGEPPQLNNTVALMRAPKFVVDYVRVAAQDQGAMRVGVFVAADNQGMEDAFAKAEPVTHDRWKREGGRAKFKPVSWTLQSISELTSHVDPLDVPPSQGGATVGVARVSRILGNSLIGVTGKGAERTAGSRNGTPSSGGPKGKRSKPRAALTSGPRFVASDAESVVIEFTVETELSKDQSESGLQVVPSIRVLAEAGTSLSLESDEATIEGWFDGPNKIAGVGGFIGFDEARQIKDLRLRVRHKKSVAVMVDVAATDSEEASV